MSVSREDVQKIAALARLELSEDDTVRMTRDMNEMLAHVEKLQQLDTENVPLHSFLEGRHTPLMPDVETKFDNTEAALENSPRREGRFFIVPKVIE
ncbi:MAG: Asp-tRNA(Asn)/Glu-tRNA(Gln) amidotransferase subunit GatC [Gemmatimonadota bacterium]|nr:Asp-tRNA(Asn)/Glu-tRNA(Gln) amidotransferase subunit GatC [Gemmatimonadota bacterium]